MLPPWFASCSCCTTNGRTAPRCRRCRSPRGRATGRPPRPFTPPSPGCSPGRQPSSWMRTAASGGWNAEPSRLSPRRRPHSAWGEPLRPRQPETKPKLCGNKWRVKTIGGMPRAGRSSRRVPPSCADVCSVLVFGRRHFLYHEFTRRVGRREQRGAHLFGASGRIRDVGARFRHLALRHRADNPRRDAANAQRQDKAASEGRRGRATRSAVRRSVPASGTTINSSAGAVRCLCRKSGRVAVETNALRDFHRRTAGHRERSAAGRTTLRAARDRRSGGGAGVLGDLS